MIADDLLDIALRLAQGSPNQTDLRRAISSVYYSVFHSICQSNADSMLGDNPQDRDQGAWRQTYRALEHGYANRRCRSAQSNSRFSPAVQNLARHFVEMQNLRHQADYDPDEIFFIQDVLTSISETNSYISAFLAAPEMERRAFAVYVLMRDRQE